MIPSVDLSLFTEGSAASRLQFVKDLGTAYHEVGFVAVKNHGIPESQIASLYEQVKAFFALPEPVKKQFELPELAGQRGYTSFGKEHAKGSTVGDLKEFWQTGQTVEDADEIRKEYPDNVFPDALLPEFRSAMLTAYRSFEQSGSSLLRAIALYLELDEHYFEEKIYHGNSILRAIHYPPVSGETHSAIRAEQHEDINLITLLVGASADGLQVLSRQNEWVPVTALPGQIVVNVGDMLQRLTNNVLKSTTHRVVNPPKEQAGTARFSIPFFLHPRSEMRLDCLPSCVTPENPIHYTPISAGEYLDQRLIEIGLKK